MKNIFNRFFLIMESKQFLILLFLLSFNKIYCQIDTEIPSEVPVNFEEFVSDSLNVELTKLITNYENSLYNKGCDGITERYKIYSKQYLDYFENIKRHALYSNFEKLKFLSLGEIELVIKMRSRLTTIELETLNFKDFVIKLNCYELPYTFPYYGKLTKLIKSTVNHYVGTYESHRFKADIFFYFEDDTWKINPFGGTPYGMIYDMKLHKTISKEEFMKTLLSKEGLSENILIPLK